MINPINLNQVNSKYQVKKHVSDTIVQNQPSNQLELSDYKSAQAILARNNITFRNLSQPIEVTDRYNKPIPGKDHLDLPNIHVYEYPDTNLQVIINVDESYKVNDFQSEPQYLLSINPNKNSKINPINYFFITKILAEKFEEAGLKDYFSEELMIMSGQNQRLEFSKIEKFNELLTTSDFGNIDFVKLKSTLIQYILSDDFYEQWKIGKNIFKNYKSQSTIINEIEKVQPKILEAEYAKFLNNSQICASLTIDKKEFDIKKNEIFKLLNKGINKKFSKESEPQEERIILQTPIMIKDKYIDNIGEYRYFIPDSNPEILIKSLIISKLLMQYSSEEQTMKENYIHKKAITEAPNVQSKEELETLKKIIELYEENVSFWNSYSNIPRINKLKIDNYLGDYSNSLRSGSYYTIFAVNNTNNGQVDLIKDLNLKKKVFTNIINSDFSKDLNKIKDDIKKYFKNNLTQETLTLNQKNINIALMNTNIFQVYELIDSISDNDIRNFIDEYFINSEPLVVSKI